MLVIDVSDQGSLNRAGLDYSVYKLGLCILPLWDPYHRCWNDLRDSLKKVGTLFKTFLSFALFFNINYGPSGSKTWFQKKQAKRTEFVNQKSAHSNPFLQYLPYIQEERGLPEPADSTGKEGVFNSIWTLNNFNALGPVAKLMRWFSWFQCDHYYSGEIWFTKMVMVDSLLPEDGVQNQKVKETDQMHFPSNLTPKQELQKLKQQHGCYALAPMLVTPESMQEKELISLICKPLWRHFSSKASTVLKPSQVMAETIEKASGLWKQELLDLVVNGFQTPAVFKKLYPERKFGDFEHNAQFNAKLQVHCKFLLHLLGKRSCSLVYTYLRPPFRYCSLLTASTHKTTQLKIQKDFDKIMSLEASNASGQNCGPLDCIHILGSSFMRLLFLLNERDIAAKRTDASTLLEVAVCHQGDTACIESTHSAAKDILRDSRHNVRSRIHKQFAVQNSKVMDSRRWDHITVSDMEKASASIRAIPPFGPYTHPNSHKLKKCFQEVMKQKSGQHYWPATTPQSLFNEVISFEWLVEQHPKTTDTSMTAANLSCLVGKAGSIVAKRDGQAFLVLHEGNCGFLGWVLKASSAAQGYPCFECSVHLSAIQFQHVTDMDQWVDVPWEPQCKDMFGPLVFRQNAPARKLIMARLQEGLALTIAQVNMVLALHGVAPKRSRANAYTALIEIFIQGEQQRKDFFDKSNAYQPEEEEKEEEDEGYQELLDALDEADAENRGDPDLKAEKSRLKKKKAQGPGTLLVAPRGKGRGRGRGKGKGKGGRGKGKGKGRGKFSTQKRFLEKHQESEPKQPPTKKGKPSLPVEVETPPASSLPKDDNPGGPSSSSKGPVDAESFDALLEGNPGGQSSSSKGPGPSAPVAESFAPLPDASPKATSGAPESVIPVPDASQKATSGAPESLIPLPEGTSPAEKAEAEPTPSEAPAAKAAAEAGRALAPAVPGCACFQCFFCFSEVFGFGCVGMV